MDQWSEPSLAALRALSAAVYPPSDEEWPGQSIRWDRPQFGVRVEDDAGGIVSYAGLLLRDAAHDGSSVRIGGIGGVMTHPEQRGLGHAATAMRAAQDFFVSETDAAIGLLVCEDSLIPYYGRLGWKVFEGVMLTEQDEGRVEFTFNRVMVRGVHRDPPLQGVIDLQGPPW